MKPAEFITKLDDQRVVQAIVDAERVTSGQIRVFVSERTVEGDAVARAAERFEKLGMTATRERNGVLLYFAPLSHKFAVIGDTGIHEKCGQPFWEEVSAAMGTLLRSEQFTEAVVDTVRKVGEVLARHFPRREDGGNELPNEVARD
jgi:uncharacterized membrane protein